MCCRPCQFICAFFIPPLAVMCHSGCTGSFFINVVLTLLGFLPGVVHAIYVICTQKSQDKAIRMTTNVNVVTPQAMPMYQPVQPPPAPVYYAESPPAPPVYYPDPGQRF